MAAFVERALRDTENTPETLFVFEIDTFGGRVDSALKIVDTILGVPKGRTIAFVSNKAISAGALIALACNELVMRPNTTLGDVAPITQSQEGPKMMGEKFQSPLRAKFRALAKKNGYPEVLAESMVSADMEVFRVESGGGVKYMDAIELAEFREHNPDAVIKKKTVVAKGELLTMDDVEALELGFSKMTAGSVEEMLDNLGVAPYEVVRVEQSWSENLGRLIASVSPILLMIGLAMIYVEIKAPGFGAPGIVGLTCLGLVFFNQYLVGLADYTELLLVILGIVLLAFEVFVIPGFGLAGPAGFLAIAAGMILALQDFTLPDPAIPWQGDIFFSNIIQVLGSFAVGFLVALLFLRYMLPRLGRLVDGPYLATTLAGSHADSSETGRLKPGAVGLAHTFLRPAGKAEIGEEYYDVITEGEFVEQGAEIMVTEIRGNRVIVARKVGK